jgi:hypothetical protein
MSACGMFSIDFLCDARRGLGAPVTPETYCISDQNINGKELGIFDAVCLHRFPIEISTGITLVVK